MPRIKARTVAEHRSGQEAELSRLARVIFDEDGPGGLTLAALAKRSGLSRPALYVYFSSRDDLLAHVYEQAVAHWVTAVLAAMDAEEAPAARLRAFIDAQLLMAAGDHHDDMLVASAANESSAVRARVRAAHAPLRDALHDTLRALGATSPDRAANLVQGVVASAYDQIRAGAEPNVVIDDAHRFIDGGLSSLDRPADGGGDRDQGDPPPSPGVVDGIAAAAAVDAAGRTTEVPAAAPAAQAPSMPNLFAVSLRRPGSPALGAPAPALRVLRRRSTALLACTMVSIGVGVAAAWGWSPPSWQLHMALGVVGTVLGLSTAVAAFRAGVGRRAALTIVAMTALTLASPRLGDQIGWSEGNLHLLAATALVVALVALVRLAWRDATAGALLRPVHATTT